MKLEQVQEVIESTPKGANIVLEWERSCSTLKGVNAVITKQVRMIGRIGIEYDNQVAVHNKRESGELPAANAGLPWGQWAIYPWLIEHNGEHYLRLYVGTSKTVHPAVTFLMDGKEVDKELVQALLLAKEKQESKGDCFTCKLSNLTRVHRVVETETVDA